MKHSPHHHKHLKHQAIKEANLIEATEEAGVENPNFKKSFEAKENKLPHKESHHHKKRSKRASCEDIHEPDGSCHIHDTTEKRLKNAEKKIQTDNKYIKVS